MCPVGTSVRQDLALGSPAALAASAEATASGLDVAGGEDAHPANSIAETQEAIKIFKVITVAKKIHSA